MRYCRGPYYVRPVAIHFRFPLRNLGVLRVSCGYLAVHNGRLISYALSFTQVDPSEPLNINRKRRRER